MTDRELKKLINEAEGRGKIFLNDGTGLFLRFAAGRPYWTFTYKNPESGRPTLKGFGRYPNVSMAAAKQALIKFKADLLEGNTPQAQREAARQQQRETLTFRQVAADWFARRTTNLTPQYRQQITSRLARHILPDIGDIPITV